MKKPAAIKKDATCLDKTTLILNFTEGDVPSLHPNDLIMVMRGVGLSKWLYEGLTRLNLSGEYELAGADQVTLSHCKTTYTFTLKDNYYSNGDLVTAFDYENFWKESLKKDSKTLKAHLFYCIKNAEKAKKGEVSLDAVGIQALDKKTLRVQLQHPTPHFLNLIALPPFMPFKCVGDEPLFNGPYLVEKWKPNDCLLLRANPFFWDSPQTSIEKIKILMVQDPSSVFALYEKGEIDWIGDPFCWLPAEIMQTELSLNKLKKQKNIMIPFWLHLNTQSFPLSSPHIRQALSCVINRKEICDHIFIGDDPLFSPSPGIQFDGEERTVDNNVERGKRLFQEGMNTLGLSKDTFPKLTLSSSDIVSFKRLAEYLQEKWQTIFGIQVDVDVQEWSTFYSNITQGKYQIGGYFNDADYRDPLANLEALSTLNNYPQWNCQEYRDAICSLQSEDNMELRKDLFQKISKILETESPIIFLVNKGHYYGARSDLKGVCFDHIGVPDFRWAYFD